MNSFGSTTNEAIQGILKNDYRPESHLQQVLNKKRKKLAQTKLGLESEEDKENENG